MLLAERFASIANRISAAVGGPYHAGRVNMPGRVKYDDGGSIVTPAAPMSYDCMVQVEAVTEAMRAEAGFAEKDVRLMILRNGLFVEINTDATVEVLAGPFAGASYSIQSVGGDGMAVYWDCRGRRA